jgi:hypothetical protein
LALRRLGDFGPFRRLAVTDLVTGLVTTCDPFRPHRLIEMAYVEAPHRRPASSAHSTVET